MAKPVIRLGVDIGGTFTDVVLRIDQQQFSTKVLTTHHVPEEAILIAITEVCEKAGILPSKIEQIVHGTTLATNALIERNGAKVALITTKGFRDVIEMRTESRFEQYDLNLKLPEPLLSREHRYCVRERIAANGDVLLPLNEDDVQALVATLKSEGYDSIAIGLMHAYANSDHEKRIAGILHSHLPGLMVSLSSEVSSQMREYERFNTVVANAYIKPMMKTYLGRLRERLGEVGIDCPVFMMHSGGGIISLENAANFPVRLVESGPAGGAVFAAHIAAKYNLDKVLSFDMGGTTAKICLIKEQTPKTSRVFEVARSYRFKKGSGMPISIPVIDMVEIGAGGGSLAYVDELAQIRVGPQSAGSQPGPACYARGGERPAVTDADLVLGRLDADNFAGGSIILDKDKAKNAVHKHIGEKLDMNPEIGAFGICEMVDENMANAARVHAVENGENLDDYTMIAFGGAAPLHAARVCEKLGIDRLLIPEGAGVGSAIGFLKAPFSFEATRSLYMRLSDYDAPGVEKMLSQLREETSQFVRDCGVDEELVSILRVYMRYAGQGSEIPVVVPEEHASAPDFDILKELFEHHYRALFERTVEDVDIEITVWAVNTSTVPEKIIPVQQVEATETYKSSVKRLMFDSASAEFVDSAVVDKTSLENGEKVNGPAAFPERETTIIIPSQSQAILQKDGCMDVRLDIIGGDTKENRGSAR